MVKTCVPGLPEHVDRIPISPGTAVRLLGGVAASKALSVLFLGSLVAAGDTSPKAPAVHFEDVTGSAGIRFVHESGASEEKFMVETFGSGVAWIDFDNDGYLDLYFVNGADLARGEPSPGNVLYRNNGDGTFTDVTQSAGVAGYGAYGTGVAVGDFDNDGFLDLYVTNLGPNILYRNNGDGTFTDVTEEAGVAGGEEWSSSAGFFDSNRNGRLDLYVVNYLEFDREENPWCGFRREGYRMYCNPAMFDGVADRLFRNDGNGSFSDVSLQAGIANPAGKGLGVTFCDVDGDGNLDIYVANDLVRNFLFLNNGDGSFRDVSYSAGVGFDRDGKPQAGMGTDCGDINANGLFDLFVTNFSEELNTLYVNRGDGLFEDLSEELGLGSGFIPLAFGTRLFDFDNDGDLDIYVTNGHVIDNVELYHPQFSHPQHDLLYENLGGHFRDVSDLGGPGMKLKRVGRGLAVGDFDNDGALDVVITNVGEAPILLRNAATGLGNWLLLEARGRRSNRFGIGARVTVETDEGRQVRVVNNTASYLSSSDHRLHVGLGEARTVRSLEVLWPSGVVQRLENVAANQILVVEEP